MSQITPQNIKMIFFSNEIITFFFYIYQIIFKNNSHLLRKLDAFYLFLSKLQNNIIFLTYINASPFYDTKYQGFLLNVIYFTPTINDS